MSALKDLSTILFLDERFKVLQALVAYRHGSLTAVAILSRVSSSSDMYGQALLLRGTCLGGMNEVEKAQNTLAEASEWFKERRKDWGVVAAGLQTRDVEETQVFFSYICEQNILVIYSVWKIDKTLS